MNRIPNTRKDTQTEEGDVQQRRREFYARALVRTVQTCVPPDSITL
jgi:hypothetical protein